MPNDVAAKLAETGLLDRYAERPRYQRNDYLAWITRAKRPETRQKRIDQMVAELTSGGLYMGMVHRPSARHPYR